MGKIYIGQNLLADTKETMLSAASDVGAIFMWGSDKPPKGCLLCDGAEYSRTEYSQLFNVIGTTYGAGDGSTTFNVPDMRGRVAVGKDSAQTEFDALNEAGGEKAHTLTIVEMPTHTHAQDSHNHTQNPHAHREIVANLNGYGGPDGVPSGEGWDGAYHATGITTESVTATNNLTTATNQNTGGSGAHNNLQPYRVINFVIRYLPSLNEKTNLGDTLPIGTMTEYPSDNVPMNWLLCNGQAVSRTDYAELFAVIGTLYGAGDGSTTFNLPDMRGRVVVGKDAAQAEFDALNEAGGEKAHTLTYTEAPTGQIYTDTGYKVSFNSGGSGDTLRIGYVGTDGSPSSGSLIVGGGNQPHNNLQPYRVLNYIIKAKHTVPVDAAVEDSLASESTTNALSAKQGNILLSLITRPNLIINGNFDIWQRGTIQTSLGYGSDDRWFNTHLGSTKTHSRQAFTPGQTEVPGNPAYYSRTVVSSVTGELNYVTKQYVLEDVARYSGKTLTLSFWARAEAPKYIAIEFFQNFGSGGSSTVSGIGVTKLLITTIWKKYIVTVGIPSVYGKVIGSNNFLKFNIWFDAGSGHNPRTDLLGHQSGTFDIAQVKLEEGNIATPFVPKTFAEELRDCQRYFEKSYDYDVAPGSENNYGNFAHGVCDVANRIEMFVNYATRKRIQPTIRFWSYYGEESKVSVVYTGLSGYGEGLFVQRAYEGGYFRIQGGTGLTVGQEYMCHWAADAEL
ncbi:MAG: phage tail protein [Burkholderiales bacterium]